MIEDFVGSSTTPITTFNLSSATPDHFQTVASRIRTTARLITRSCLTDNKQVHLELLNNYGDRIGSDFVVPRITSFDTLQTIFDTANNAYRVELDYTAADPKGGTEIEGFIYDTPPTGDFTTLSGGGEYAGTPFDDTFIDASGNYAINGGGGQDNFQINQDSNEVALFTQLFASTHYLHLQQHESDCCGFDRDDDAPRLYSYQP